MYRNVSKFLKIGLAGILKNVLSISYSKKIVPYIFIAPFFIMFLFFWIVPIGNAFYISLTKWDAFSPPSFVGFNNYAKLFATTKFYTALRNTLLAGAVYILALVSLALCIAVVLNQSIKGRNFFRTCVFAPVTMALIVVALVFKVILSEHGGLLNQLLHMIGMKQNINWLGTSRLALWSIVMLRIWRATGYYSIFFLAGLQSIPVELYEVARTDGASRWKCFIHITLPLLKPIFGFVIVASSIWALRLFDEPWVLTKGGPGNSTLTMVIYLYQKAFQEFELGYAASISYILTFVIIFYSFLQLKLFRVEREQ